MRNNNKKIVIRCTDKEKESLLRTKIQLKARTWLELVEKLRHKKKIEAPKIIIQDSLYLFEILTQLKRCGNNLNQITRTSNRNKTITESETIQLKKLAIQISSLKNKVLKTIVINGKK
ncbi:plasmid mobilization relaxosome protein MobC [Methylococcaceae bacterium CS1]|nr:plasmid mobilization relaxosome protein MobC [Methylococcaceae bacterium CS5]TXL02800.1 plasmid mobilization relaxosome protein MobC [Methylococcaceae bacterium CS1]